MTTIKQALERATSLLRPHDEARSDAEILLCHHLNVSRAFLYAHDDETLCPQLEADFQSLILARQAGQPVAYLIGSKEFWSLKLTVNSSTLIPRPETELLVEKTLELSLKDTIQLLELGTGSGAIALALAQSRPTWHITATELSTDALQTAQLNAQHLSLHHVHFLQSDWFEHVPLKQFDVIISNPPYLAEHDPHLVQGDLRFEPRHALASGPDGLDALNCIISKASQYLTPQGLLLLEHGYQQASAVERLLHAHGFIHITCHLDFQGHPRITSAQVR